jgi:hypothetical protein
MYVEVKYSVLSDRMHFLSQFHPYVVKNMKCISYVLHIIIWSSVIAWKIVRMEHVSSGHELLLVCETKCGNQKVVHF